MAWVGRLLGKISIFVIRKYIITEYHEPMIKIVAEATVPYLEGVLEEFGEVEYIATGDWTHDRIKDADWLIIRSITRCDRALLEGTRVRLITTATIGFDHIDTAYCREAGIAWYNAPGCNAEAVGLYFGAMMAVLALDGRFDPRGKRLGIVGVGHVGRVIERYARAFEMEVLRNDPPLAEAEGPKPQPPSPLKGEGTTVAKPPLGDWGGSWSSLEEIARESDMITFHTPLTKSGKYPTLGLVDDELVAQLERQPIIVNACRGAVTETDALLKGLEQKRIGAVIIDCWEGEPHISEQLLQKAYLATPHIAGFSEQGKANGARMAVARGIEFFGLQSSRIEQMYPQAVEQPLLHLYSNHPLWEALIKILDLRKVDASLRNWTGLFEQLRVEYVRPYEPSSYQLLESELGEWAEAARQIGFEVLA